MTNYTYYRWKHCRKDNVVARTDVIDAISMCCFPFIIFLAVNAQRLNFFFDNSIDWEKAAHLNIRIKYG